MVNKQMSVPIKRATSFTMDRNPDAVLVGQVTLTFSDRFRRRIRLSMDSGEGFMLDLPKVTQLRDGGFLNLMAGPERAQKPGQVGEQVGVRAAVEDVLDVHSIDPSELVRWAWHLGNRHLPVEFLGQEGLRIAWDPVIADMLRGLGAEPRRGQAPFGPEGGAYGGGPTYSHDHGHGHGHGHDDGHGQDHQRLTGNAGGHRHEP